ncbi:MAG: alcohol dehydrogenase catalytic domain-containing protein [Clostridiales bacterium]|jgi:threonine dehydrogenase-like Zn-dependent dehydrogenase|nr:alcohol dehydrogenase catalytic domain-containing protein [Clostridiales bacterium]
MKRAVLNPSGGYRFEETETPAPGNGEALIRVLACGLCSSDVEAWRSGLGVDTVMGHEVVGIVEELGAGVSGIAVGERVTGCIMRGYAEYTTARAEHMIVVPDALSDAEAIVEPFVCLLSGIERAAPKPDSDVAVISAGFMGLGLVRLLKIAGVRHVTALDLRPQALETAREMGADETLPADAAQGRKFDMVFEAAGTQSAIDLSGELCAPYGVIAIVGYHPCVRQVDMRVWAAKAPVVMNIFEYRRPKQLEYMRRALKLAVEGRLRNARLMTHSFPLSQLQEAFAFHAAKRDGYIKGWINDFQH